ncbi:rod shape-determining protein MreD [Croceitalea vernalis]|uniref:Rod shape-determining protein MreD n=1 Tax=Croceitalea vernalis TaxID=3075599 RepID=A0ABU3BC16_9FLAO|nr:rod shape-determining protein MreD [Croceitalea sp. P007]MDT0620018.1 rod shape-determining protein MreD [Croceitalea sp. P007]
MLSNPIVINIIRFVLLVLIQVLIFNQLNFFGYINPLIYVLFFYWYPIRENRAIFILVSFLLGLLIDLFSDTLALHTMVAITLAYARPLIMRFCFGANFDFQGFTFKNSTRVQRITFLFILIIIQHVIYFSFEILSFSHILLILQKILFTSLATFILCILLSSLFATDNE